VKRDESLSPREFPRGKSESSCMESKFFNDKHAKMKKRTWSKTVRVKKFRTFFYKILYLSVVLLPNSINFFFFKKKLLIIPKA
jgi:hypothetical protein